MFRCVILGFTRRGDFRLKESNRRARAAAFDLLVTTANKMKDAGEIRRYLDAMIKSFLLLRNTTPFYITTS